LIPNVTYNASDSTATTSGHAKFASITPPCMLISNDPSPILENFQGRTRYKCSSLRASSQTSQECFDLKAPQMIFSTSWFRHHWM
jgi:hypothetical protein